MGHGGLFLNCKWCARANETQDPADLSSDTLTSSSTCGEEWSGTPFRPDGLQSSRGVNRSGFISCSKSFRAASTLSIIASLRTCLPAYAVFIYLITMSSQTSFLRSTLWIPEHISGFIASYMALRVNKLHLVKCLDNALFSSRGAGCSQRGSTTTGPFVSLRPASTWRAGAP